MNRTLRYGVSVLGLLGALLIAAPGARAGDLVVVEAKGVSLQPGQSVDGSKVLKLEAGQRLTLIASDGKTIKLRGPYEEAPAPAQTADAGGVVDSLRNLVSARSAGTASLGVVRSASEERPLPEPWLVDVSKPGNRCLIENSQAVFWRPDSAQSTTMEVRPADRSWQAKTTWPAASEKLGMPPNLPLRDGQTYQVEMSGSTASLTFHIIPASINKDAVRAAWMVEKGCEAQAAALVRTIQ